VQQAGEAAIAGQDPHVFDALAAGRLDEYDRLELVELRVPRRRTRTRNCSRTRSSRPKASSVSDTNVRPACAVRSIGRALGSTWKERMPWPLGIGPQGCHWCGGYYGPGHAVTSLHHWVHGSSRLVKGSIP